MTAAISKIKASLNDLGIGHFFNNIYAESIGGEDMQMVRFERNNATMSLDGISSWNGNISSILMDTDFTIFEVNPAI